jgi:uncharacterized protein
MSVTTFKVVVTGPFGAGKTTFINAVSDTPVLRTETEVSDDTAGVKKDTTVALDYGSITIEGDDPAQDGVELLIFGTPGQTRFDFMWRILAEGADGYVLLVDASRPQSVAEAVDILASFRGLDPDLTFVVGANRTEPGDAGVIQLEQLGDTLEVSPIQIFQVDVLDATSCVGLLLELLEGVLERVETLPEDLLPDDLSVDTHAETTHA